MKARLAVVLGDPAGIGSELIAKLMSRPETLERAAILLVCDRTELDEGMRLAGQQFDYRLAGHDGDLSGADGVVVFEYEGRRPFARAEATATGGAHSLETLGRAIDLARRGVVEGVLFAPLNKTSMHLAGLAHADESQWFAHLLGAQGPHGELNFLDGLWTTRVTSHVALRDVADLVTRERVLDAIALAHSTLRDGGVARPRIAVCGLNPHNGENGTFGREEIEVIGPAVEEARARGLPATGPFPADTIFLKARNYDAVVTMYHDQGQIAMKLMGFARGVTVHGGLPFPITTPAHGTAFDIQGRGVADVGATQAAFDLCVDLVLGRRRAKPHPTRNDAEAVQ